MIFPIIFPPDWPNTKVDYPDVPVRWGPILLTWLCAAILLGLLAWGLGVLT